MSWIGETSWARLIQTTLLTVTSNAAKNSTQVSPSDVLSAVSLVIASPTNTATVANNITRDAAM